MQILVIDDDALAREMIAAVLEEQGHRITQAEQALQALECLETHPEIEVIVSDLNMPLMSGLELFHELKAAGSKRPFILLTGDDPATILAQEPGLNACLIKDFSMDTSLSAALAQLTS